MCRVARSAQSRQEHSCRFQKHVFREPTETRFLSSQGSLSCNPPPRWALLQSPVCKHVRWRLSFPTAAHTCTELQVCLQLLVLLLGSPPQLLQGRQGSKWPYLLDMGTRGGDKVHPARPAGEHAPGERETVKRFPSRELLTLCRPTAGPATQPLPRLHYGFKTKINRPGS